MIESHSEHVYLIIVNSLVQNMVCSYIWLARTPLRLKVYEIDLH